MTISSTLATGLMATRLQSDLEYKLQAASSRRISLLGESRKVSEQVYQSMFTPDPYDDAAAQNKLNQIHAVDKALEEQMKMLETQLKIYTQIKEENLKLAKQNAKKDFTIG